MFEGMAMYRNLCKFLPIFWVGTLYAVDNDADYDLDGEELGEKAAHDRYPEYCQQDSQCPEYMRCKAEMCTCPSGYSFSHPFASCEQSKKIFRQFRIKGPSEIFLSTKELIFTAIIQNGTGNNWRYRWIILDGISNAKFKGTNEPMLSLTELKPGFILFGLSISNDEMEGYLLHNLTIFNEQENVHNPILYEKTVTVTLPTKFAILEPTYSENVDTFKWEPFDEVPASMLTLANLNDPKLLIVNLVTGQFLFNLIGFNEAGNTSIMIAVEVRTGSNEDFSLDLLVMRSKGEEFLYGEQKSLLLTIENILRQKFQINFLLDVGAVSFDIETELLSLQLLTHVPETEPGGERVKASDLISVLYDNASLFEVWRIISIKSTTCGSSKCTCDTFWAHNVFGIFYDDSNNECVWSTFYIWPLIVFILVIFLRSAHFLWQFQEKANNWNTRMTQNLSAGLAHCISVHKGRFSPVRMMQKKKELQTNPTIRTVNFETNYEFLADNFLLNQTSEHEEDSSSENT